MRRGVDVPDKVERCGYLIHAFQCLHQKHPAVADRFLSERKELSFLRYAHTPPGPLERAFRFRANRDKSIMRYV